MKSSVKGKAIRKTIITVLLALTVLAIVRIFLGRYPQLLSSQYLPIHTMLEMFSVIVSFLIAMQGWVSYPNTSSRNQLVLGNTFFAVGILDCFHLLSYPGMPTVLPIGLGQVATWFWILARTVESITLILVFSYPDRKINFPRWQFTFAFTTFISLALAYIVANFYSFLPRLIILGVGLTKTKIFMEYFLIMVHAITMFILIKRYYKEKNNALLDVFCGLNFLLFGETVFTLYINIYDYYNLLGHLYKVLGYWHLMKGIYITGALQPFENIKKVSAEVKNSETRFMTLVQSMDDIVYELDLNMRYLGVYGRWLDRLGLSADMILNKTAEDIFGEVEADCHFKANSKALNGEVVVYEWVHGEPLRYYQTTLSPKYNEQNQIIGLVGVARDITAQKHIEESLRESEQLFRTLADSSPVMMWLTDVNGGCTFVNKSWLDFTGKSLEYALGEGWIQEIHPEDFQSSRTVFYSHFESKSNFKTETRLRRVDGQYRWVFCIGVPRYTSAGNFAGFVGSCVDITDLKESTEALKREKNLFVSGPVVMFRWSNEKGWPVKYVSQNITQFGYTPYELLDKQFSDIIYPADLHVVTEQFNQYSKDGVSQFTQDYRIVKPDGSVRWVYDNTIVETNEKGEIEYLYGYVLDITERKEIEEKLRASQERYALAIQGTNEGIWDWNLVTNEVFYSPVWKKMLGFEENEVKNTTNVWKNLVHPEDLPLALLAMQRHFQGISSYYHIEHRLKTKDGSYKWILARGQAVFSASGEPLRMVGSHKDISERKFSEQIIAEKNIALAEALDQAQHATKSKSDFLATISHEIRTPINAIIGTTELLKDTEISLEQSDYINTVVDSAKMLLFIINDILDYSKLEAGKTMIENYPFDLYDTMHSITKIFAPMVNEKGLHLELDIQQDVPNLVTGDQIRLKQILTNLIGNAVKFTKEGFVKITLLLNYKTDAEVEIRCEITDSGIGIPVERQARLFQPFIQADTSTTRQFGGTGLGLSISKKLIELMGGEIGLVSTPDQGSTFWFNLPFQNAFSAANEVASSYEIPEQVNYNKQVLLVDDNEINRKIAVKQLESIGFRHIDTASNGREAVEAVEEKNYDLILMDCQMPVMDGFEATRMIRQKKQFRKIPIIAITALAQGEDRKKGLAVGMDNYITKPVDRQVLKHILYETMTNRNDKDIELECEQVQNEMKRMVIDPKAIAQIKALAEDDILFLQEIVEEYISSGAKHLNDIEQSMTQENFESLAFHAHSLKSMSGYIGAFKVVECSHQLEEISRKGIFIGTAEILAMTKKEFKKASEELSHLLG